MIAPLGPLRYAVIELTNRCNLRCPHCASTSGQARADELSTVELCDVLAEIRALGGEEITLIGGEIFLREDWFAIAQRVVELGLRLIVISNGLLIDEAVRAQLRELKPHLLGLSLDGASRESYRRHRGVDGFDQILALLQALHADGHANVNAITTVMRSNLAEFDAFVALFLDSPITWQLQIANRGGRRFDDRFFISRADYHALCAHIRTCLLELRGRLRLRLMDDIGYFPLDPAFRFLHQCWNGCIAGRQLIGLRSNGDVLGCLSLGDGHEDGNIRQRPLRELWLDPGAFPRLRHKTLSGHCRSCVHAEACGAGCGAMAESTTGSLGCNAYCLHLEESEGILADLFG
jgi:radical SAM protein with 4Fe4S-binding SPASM domain